MTVVMLAAGAGEMYCGSCLRDNRLAATLLAQGRDVILLPLYTPLRTDETDVSSSPIHYGGISVYLRQRFAFLRGLPAAAGRMLSGARLLRWAARRAAKTDPRTLGALTVSVLRGAAGPQRKELDGLLHALKAMRPSLVHLPDLMFVGIAGVLRRALNVPILCSLAGEDIFLDALPEPYRQESFDLMAAGAADIDGFIAPTRYYAEHSARHFRLPAERISYVPLGIHVEDFAPAAPADGPLVIGYLARICPEKGLRNLCDAFIALRRGGRDCRLRAAGYLGAGDRDYFDQTCGTLRAHGCHEAFEYVGEVSRGEKAAFLRSIHVFSVPTVYHEAKGLPVLEAQAAGVPAVQPRHGSFPELLEATGGGVLYSPGDPGALAAALGGLLDDAPRRAQMGQRAAAGVRAAFTDAIMAEKTWSLYERFIR